MSKRLNFIASANSDYILTPKFMFTHEFKLYVGTDYVPGGTVGDLLSTVGCFEEKHARFYISQLISALEYLHMIGIIHRAVSPNCMMIDFEGLILY